MEAITDPRLNAWQDSTGGAGENGDKCNVLLDQFWLKKGQVKD